MRRSATQPAGMTSSTCTTVAPAATSAPPRLGARAFGRRHARARRQARARRPRRRRIGDASHERLGGCASRARAEPRAARAAAARGARTALRALLPAFRSRSCCCGDRWGRPAPAGRAARSPRAACGDGRRGGLRRSRAGGGGRRCLCCGIAARGARQRVRRGPATRGRRHVRSLPPSRRSCHPRSRWSRRVPVGRQAGYISVRRTAGVVSSCDESRDLWRSSSRDARPDAPRAARGLRAVTDGLPLRSALSAPTSAAAAAARRRRRGRGLAGACVGLLRLAARRAILPRCGIPVALAGGRERRRRGAPPSSSATSAARAQRPATGTSPAIRGPIGSHDVLTLCNEVRWWLVALRDRSAVAKRWTPGRSRGTLAHEAERLQAPRAEQPALHGHPSTVTTMSSSARTRAPRRRVSQYGQPFAQASASMVCAVHAAALTPRQRTSRAASRRRGTRRLPMPTSTCVAAAAGVPGGTRATAVPSRCSYPRPSGSSRAEHSQLDIEPAGEASLHRREDRLRCGGVGHRRSLSRLGPR